MFEEIMDKIIELYQKLIDAEYDHWYNRDTMTSYEHSYEFSNVESLCKERDEFLNKLKG